ncbi:MAG: ABC transporter ATP-binding protein [Verrucomicrobiota bacterium]|nr:ABC transporter ATP-binding protein [Verrucomicrobiota bacterium]
MPVGNGLLSLENVTKSFGAVGDASKVEILNGVNLRVEPGATVAIIGPSGSGKSTLLNIIGTLDKATSGSVEFEGRELTFLSADELAAVRSQNIGFIFQGHHLLPQCTVFENVLVPTLANPANQPGVAAERARKLLERVGLGARLNHKPGQLSGGERQRVAVVRALINKPKLLLADEPTGALDRDSAENLATLLLELNREQNVALVLVTHARDLAFKMSRVLELQRGTLVQVEAECPFGHWPCAAWLITPAVIGGPLWGRGWRRRF